MFDSQLMGITFQEIDRFLLKVTIDKLVQSNQDDVDNLLSGVSDSLIQVSSVGWGLI